MLKKITIAVVVVAILLAATYAAIYFSIPADLGQIS
jgi:hypothetical protein